MMHSMTAYASAEKTGGTPAVSVEIRSLNSRNLDIVLRVPQEYMCFEEKIRNLILNRLTRGRIEIRIVIKDDAGQTVAFEVDDPRAAALDKALTRLKDRYAWGVQVPLEFLAGPGGVIRPVQESIDPDAGWPSIETCLTAALDDLVAMRKAEGDHIAEDIATRLDFIEKQLAKIHKEAGSLVSVYQQRLKERIDVLTRGLIEIDPARIAQEAAFLADRSDISEEIVRAESHIKQFREIMESAEPAGRKLNFLLQEFNREFNTMGAKAGNTAIAHTIVTVRSEIEKIREQVQNVE